MRIITGKYRGLKLKSPKNKNIRPTADKVKEAIFSMIASKCEKAQVLDMYCGSGALGLEALSRGAKFCLFCDSESSSLELTKENLLLAKDDNNKIFKAFWPKDFLKLKNYAPFDIILMDPPYQQDISLSLKCIERLSELNLVCSQSLLILEQATTIYKTWDGKAPENWKIIKQKSWGSNTVIIFEYQ